MELKFGPQWLRNITDGGAAASTQGGSSYLGGGGGGNAPPISGANGGGVGGHPPVRYKLAEHRYGREEMLSLFESTTEVPGDLRDMSIFVLRAQSPVLLQPQSEEEQSLLLQNVNSTLPQPSRQGGGGGRGGVSRGAGGRGESDYGRGRGYIDRGRDDEGHGRVRPKEPWDDGRGRGYAVGGSYGGQEDKFDAAGAPLNVGGGGGVHGGAYLSRSMSTENWRGAKASVAAGDEEGEIRKGQPPPAQQGGQKERWGGQRSWRDLPPREPPSEGGDDGPPAPSNRAWGKQDGFEYRGGGAWPNQRLGGGVGGVRFDVDDPQRGGARGGIDRSTSDSGGAGGRNDEVRREPHGQGGPIGVGGGHRGGQGEDENGHDALPEWSVEPNALNSVGTFDSSGAFLVPRDKAAPSRPVEGSGPPRAARRGPMDGGPHDAGPTRPTAWAEPKVSTTKPLDAPSTRASPPKGDQGASGRSPALLPASRSPVPPSNLIPAAASVPPARPAGGGAPPLGGDGAPPESKSGDVKQGTVAMLKGPVASGGVGGGPPASLAADTAASPGSVGNTEFLARKWNELNEKPQGVAGASGPGLGGSVALSRGGGFSDTGLSTTSGLVGGGGLPGGSGLLGNSLQSISSGLLSGGLAGGGLGGGSSLLPASAGLPGGSGLLPGGLAVHSVTPTSAVSSPVDDDWFYVDPQDQIQGPFKNAEMNEWLALGFFAMTLMVRAGPTGSFISLGDLIKALGRNPFLQQPPPAAPAAALPIAPPTPAKASVSPVMAQPVLGLSSTAQQQQQLQQLQQLEQLRSYQQQQQLLAAAAAQQQQQQTLILQHQQQQQLLQQQMQQYLRQQQQQHESLLMRPGLEPQVSAGLAGDIGGGGRPPTLPLGSPAAPEFLSQLLHGAGPVRPGMSPSSAMPAAHTATGFAATSSLQPAGPVPSVWDMHHPKVSAAVTLDQVERSKGMTLEQVERLQYMAAAELAPSVEKLMRSATDESRVSRPSDLHKVEAADQQQQQALLQQQQQARDEALRQAAAAKDENAARQAAAAAREEAQRQRVAHIEQREAEQRRLEEETRLSNERAAQERAAVERAARERAEAEEREEAERRRRAEAREREQAEEAERRRRAERERLARERTEVERVAREREDELRASKQRKLQETLRLKEEESRREAETVARQRAEEERVRQAPRVSAWATAVAGGGAGPNGATPLTEIQQLEAAAAAVDLNQRRRDEKLHQMEQQRQQLAALQQQRQAKQQSWTKAVGSGGGTGGAVPSLLDIQLEEALSLGNSAPAKTTYATKIVEAPASVSNIWGVPGGVSGGAWGSDNFSSSNYHGSRPSGGMWDGPELGGGSGGGFKAAANSAQFPALDSGKKKTMTTLKAKKQPAVTKLNKEEEQVQQLFKATKVKDEFTQWCETAVGGLQTSVDIPTLVDFLKDIDSPDEVLEYIRSYLGESKRVCEFGQQFLERRIKLRNATKPRPQDGISWPTTAVNPLADQPRAAALGPKGGADDKSKAGGVAAAPQGGKKKKKMQKMDASSLGFTVHADSERIQGEIDSVVSGKQ